MPPSPDSAPGRTRIETAFAGEAIVLDASGALYMPDHRLLIVSDLHLEKGSYFAERAVPMPLHDTRDTVERLARALHAYRPRRIICLGDSFHDKRAGERLNARDAGVLEGLMALVEDWLWIAGNHDPVIAQQAGGRRAGAETVGRIRLVHRPEDAAPPVMAGHYHPKYRVGFARRSVSGPCFVIGEHILLLPAFGAYAGGLSTASEPIACLFGGDPRRHALLYGGKIWIFE